MRCAEETVVAYEIDDAYERTNSDNGDGDTHGDDWSEALGTSLRQTIKRRKPVSSKNAETELRQMMPLDRRTKVVAKWQRIDKAVDWLAVTTH